MRGGSSCGERSKCGTWLGMPGITRETGDGHGGREMGRATGTSSATAGLHRASFGGPSFATGLGSGCRELGRSSSTGDGSCGGIDAVCEGSSATLVAGGTAAGVGAAVGDGDTLGGLTDVASGSSGAFSSLEAAPPPTLLLRLDRPSAPPGESTGLSTASPFFFLAAELAAVLSSSSLTGDGAVVTGVATAGTSAESSTGEAFGVVGVVGSALDAGVASSRPRFLPFVGVSGFVFFFLSLSAVLAAGDLRPPGVVRLLAVRAPSIFSGLAPSPPLLLPCLLRPFV